MIFQKIYITFAPHLKGVPNPVKEEAEITPKEPGQVMLPRENEIERFQYLDILPV